MRRTGPGGQVLLAIGVIGLAGVAGYQTAAIPVSPIYSKIGPTVFPSMVTAGLLLLGLSLLWQAVRGGWSVDEAHASERPDWPALSWLVLGLVLNVVLINPLGFILASTVLFCCVARAFGSARPLRDIGVGLALAGAAYIGFDRILGISIGAGPLEGLI